MVLLVLCYVFCCAFCGVFCGAFCCVFYYVFCNAVCSAMCSAMRSAVRSAVCSALLCGLQCVFCDVLLQRVLPLPPLPQLLNPTCYGGTAAQHILSAGRWGLPVVADRTCGGPPTQHDTQPTNSLLLCVLLEIPTTLPGQCSAMPCATSGNSRGDVPPTPAGTCLRPALRLETQAGTCLWRARKSIPPHPFPHIH